MIDSFIILILFALFSTLLLMEFVSNVNKSVNGAYEQEPIIKSDPNLKVELVYKGLMFPTSMSFLGPDDILVLEENNGTVKRIVNGTMLPKPLLNVNVATEGGRGMLGINSAKGIDGKTTYVFLYFIESSKEKEVDSRTGGKAVLYRYELKNNQLTDSKLLVDVSGPRGVGNKSDEFHNGGKVLIGPDQNVYLIIGEFSYRHTATMNFRDREPPDGNSGIIRITQNGEPVRGGAILGQTEPLNRYYAYGIRNGFGMDFDPITGKLWDTENGETFGDEINLVEPGFNSGYRVVQGIWLSNPLNISTAGSIAPEQPDGLVNFGGKGKYSTPEFSWYHTVGPTALIFLDSDKLGEQYMDDMFIADVTGGNIYHFELNESRTGLSLGGQLADKTADTEIEYQDKIFGIGFKGITDMQVGPDGYLYVLSYHYGAIFRIVPIQSMTPKQTVVNLLDDDHKWRSFGQAMLSQQENSMSINLNTSSPRKVYDRAILPAKIDYNLNKTLHLNLDYIAKSNLPNTTFFTEIIENNSSDNVNGNKKILWSSLLHNTQGILASESFILPDDIANRPVEFRLYLSTEGIGQHNLTIKKANIVR